MSSIKKNSLFTFTFLFTFLGNFYGQTVNEVVHMVKHMDKSMTRKSYTLMTNSKAKSLASKLKEFKAYLNEAETGYMDEGDQINADLLRLSLDNRIFMHEWGKHEMPLNAEGGFLTTTIFKFRGAKIATERSRRKYLELLQDLPSYIDNQISNMKSGQKRGISSPKLIVDLCLDVVNETLSDDVDSSYFLKPLLGSEIEAEAKSIVESEILPKYRYLKEYLIKEYREKAPEVIGVSHIPTGKEFYEQRVRYFTTDDITPDEVFNIGMAEVKRIRSEMEAIIDELGFEGSFDDFIEFLRSDEQFYAKDAEEILGYAKRIKEEMEGKMDQYFNRVQKLPLVVKPVPLSIALNYTAGRYSGGSYEDNRPGEYWVNTTKLESRPLYALPALSLHEGVPGHHTQIMLNQELNREALRPNLYLSAFGEGWALYCEYLGEEAGMYRTPYERFGRLVYEMWRACRLVVDPGMHYKGWTRDEAFNFMKNNTALSIHEVNTEINRYIGWPGQAVSYKIGELKIKSLRKLAETELGEDFDLKSFHDKVLSNGSVPLKTLERIMKEWIVKEKGE